MTKKLAKDERERGSFDPEHTRGKKQKVERAYPIDSSRQEAGSPAGLKTEEDHPSYPTKKNSP